MLFSEGTQFNPQLFLWLILSPTKCIALEITQSLFTSTTRYCVCVCVCVCVCISRTPRSLQGLNEVLCVKHIAWCLAHPRWDFSLLSSYTYWPHSSSTQSWYCSFDSSVESESYRPSEPPRLSGWVSPARALCRPKVGNVSEFVELDSWTLPF